MISDFFKVIAYQVIFLVIKAFPYKRRENTLLLIKMDELGDYILFRQVLGSIRNSDRYRNFRIILVATPITKQLFEFADKDLVDEVIWIQKKKFLRNLVYRFSVLKQVRQTGASDLVNFIHSSIFRLDGVIAAITPARVKTAMPRDTTIYSKIENALEPSDTYTNIIHVSEQTIFEADRNFEFTAKWLKQDPGITNINLDVTKNIDHLNLSSKYFIVFPGSGIKLKKWPIEYFVKVAAHIVKITGLVPVIAGSEADRPDCDAFKASYQGETWDLTGKTTLPEFATVLKRAACIISVDTGVVHLAAAVGCPVFALFTGLHYGRFAPYPAHLAKNFFPVYPDEIDRLIASGKITSDLVVPMDSIRSIPPSKMIEVINKNLIFAQQTSGAGTKK